MKRNKSSTNLKRKTCESNTKTNRPTVVEQLKALNINKKRKSPSRSTLFTNQNQEESLKQQIKPLQQEVQHLNCKSNLNERRNNPSLKDPKQPIDSKIAEMTSSNNRGKQYKYDTLRKTNHEYIKKLWRTVKNTTRYQSYPKGHFINLRKKTFTKVTFHFLNKNLNLIPTLKVYNKHKLNEKLESFYRLLKLKPHFKDSKCNDLRMEEQIFFKPQRKEKWTLNKNHHTVLTSIEAN